MKNHVRLSVGVGIFACIALNSVYGSAGKELLISAPIEQLDRAADTITVLGQRFPAQTDQLSVGEVVHVYGILATDGVITDAVVQGTLTYATNGDPVFVKGIVTDADPILGHARIDGMTVDYTAELSNPGFAVPNIGDLVAVAGSQPVSKGLLMARASGVDAYALGSSDGALGVAAAGLNSTGPGLDSTNANGNASRAASTFGMNGGGAASTFGMNGGGAAGVKGGGARAAGMNGGGR